MMKLKSIIALAALGIAGCTTFQDVENNLRVFKGQPLDYAIEQIGLPSRELNIAGRKVYIWENASSGSYMSQAPMTTTTRVGFQTVNTYGSVPVVQNYSYECKISMEVDKSNVVSRIEYEGNLGGCERYGKLGLDKPAAAKQ
jgi:hypothetical protein